MASSLLEPEDLYRRVGRLIETAPAFNGIAPLSIDQLTWMGRAQALVASTGGAIETAELSFAVQKLTVPASRPAASQSIMMVLYRVLAVAELASPPGAQGAFIPVGSSFDAYVAVAKVLSSATSDVMIVDPYMDDTVLIDFGGALPEKAKLRLLADKATSLVPAASKWKYQYPSRLIEVREAPKKVLHDRAIFIDSKEAWTVTQSLKDLAKRSPAEIVRADDTAALKIDAYEKIWNAAKVLV